QNIPIRSEEGRRIRAAFVAAPGHRLVSADYSQIELRVLAHLSGDQALIDAFASREDIHARTAAEVFADRPPAEGRRLAKVMNYGIVYGMGAARAARELGVSQAEAAAYIDRYLGRYPGVRAFIDATIAEARARGYVTTVLGRRRYLPELGARDPAVRQFAERAATNTPIQGSAADLIKLAMLEVRRRLAAAGGGARLLLQVHDELVLEVPADRLAAIASAVRDAMEQVFPLRDALDIVQETFTKAYQGLDRFKGDAAFYTWVYRIAYNLCVDQQRRAAKEPQLTLDADEDARPARPLAAADLHPDQPFARARDAEIARRVRAAIRDLTPDHRAVILLRELEGLSYAEISQVLDCPKGTVMSR